MTRNDLYIFSIIGLTVSTVHCPGSVLECLHFYNIENVTFTSSGVGTLDGQVSCLLAVRAGVVSLYAGCDVVGAARNRIPGEGGE